MSSSGRRARTFRPSLAATCCPAAPLCFRRRLWQCIPHAPAKLRQLYRDYFKRTGVAAILFPATLVPALPIGSEDDVTIQGQRCHSKPPSRATSRPAARRIAGTGTAERTDGRRATRCYPSSTRPPGLTARCSRSAGASPKRSAIFHRLRCDPSRDNPRLHARRPALDLRSFAADQFRVVHFHQVAGRIIRRDSSAVTCGLWGTASARAGKPGRWPSIRLSISCQSAA